MEPDLVVAVDWSGAVRGVREVLWLAVAHPAAGGGKLARLECGRDREETVAHLIELARIDPRLVVGLDFAFSFPSWFLAERGIRSAREMWELARLEGEAWLALCEPPFWGRPGKPRPDPLAGQSPFRTTESERLPVRGIAPKSVFQVGGAGAVGTGSIRGMPKLLELSAAGFSVWPFDPPRLPLVLEIYPRWMTGRTRKTDEVSRRLFLASRAGEEDPRLVEIAASSEHAFDAAASAIAMARAAAELGALERARNPADRLEGRIWTPFAPQLRALGGSRII